MLIKFVCVLLTLAVAQAFPSSDVKPTKDEPSCPQKIAWYRDITNKTNKMYFFEYSEHLTSEIRKKLDAEHTNFERLIALNLRKYEIDLHNLSSTSNDANKQTLCDKIDDYRMATVNLTRAATSLKSSVLNVIDHMEMYQAEKDSLNKSISKMVNFLLEVNMTENAFKDLEPLVKEAEIKASQDIDSKTIDATTETDVDKMFNSAVSEPSDDDFQKSVQQDIKDMTRALEEHNRIKNERVVDDYEDENDGLPIHLNPGRTLVNAFKHPALPLTIIGVILIVICGMFVWNWVRPDEWIRSRYARMP